MPWAGALYRKQDKPRCPWLPTTPPAPAPLPTAGSVEGILCFLRDRIDSGLESDETGPEEVQRGQAAGAGAGGVSTCSL